MDSNRTISESKPVITDLGTNNKDLYWFEQWSSYNILELDAQNQK